MKDIDVKTQLRQTINDSNGDADTSVIGKMCNEQILCQTFSDENQYLRAIIKLFKIIDPDLITGYNSIGFDLPYLYKRCSRVKIEKNVFMGLGQIKNDFSNMFYNHSGKMGVSTEVNCQSLPHCDLLQQARKIFNLKYYSLESVSNHALGVGKMEYEIKKIAVAFRRHDVNSFSEMYAYCARDTYLCTLLFEKMQLLPQLVNLSNLTGCDIKDILSMKQTK